MNHDPLSHAYFLITPGRWQMALKTSLLTVILLVFSSTVWAFGTYDGCKDCHGDFFALADPYTSLHDGTIWDTDLMGGHLPLVDGNCGACHNGRDAEDGTYLNFSEDVSLSKSCVGCHGRDEDVTGNCTGLIGNQSGVEAECGSGAGLRQYHELQVGDGTCSGCHGGDDTPVGENILPFNYGQNDVVMEDSCDDDGSESQFGPTGLDNDGDGQRDGDDSDCQSGGPSFSINAGHAGAWFNPDTSGQGQFIDVVPEEQFMFLSWFTFTDAASDNPNEQQWYTAQGNYSGDTAVLDLIETLGGKFDDPQEITNTLVGEVTLTFNDCDMGMMSYSFDEEELDGEFPMIRVIPGSDNVCEGLSGNNTEAVDINVGMDGAWFDPATSGQGYFIDAHPDSEGGNFIFVSWFTYGNATASGQRWLTAQGGFEGSTAEIDVFETTGGSFDDPEPISNPKVGTMSLDFTDCSNAQLSYSLPADPAEGDVAITRVIPGSQALCEELVGED
jgi:predicted CXXCH cytochrome family protein